MTEPEVSLYIALYYIKNGLTQSDVFVSIDGAHIKTGDTVYFEINIFLLKNGFVKLDGEVDRWQGEYQVDNYDAHIVVKSVPGIGDVKIETQDGKTIIVESKKGKKEKKGLEYSLMREAIGQLMTSSALNETIVPVVAVPYSEKSDELARRWVVLPQIRKVGIKFFLVKDDGDLCIVK